MEPDASDTPDSGRDGTDASDGDADPPARQYHVSPVASIASTAARGSLVKSGSSYAIGPFSRK